MKVRNMPAPIPISKIYDHPDNPRKNLGDISELTESVKKNGLMQNLTVIPGHWLTEEEYLKVNKDEGIPKSTALTNFNREDWWSDEGYTLLIGHRRCAAARAAGLEFVYCRIVEDSTKNEQVGIMLEENMQRSDLTVFEQAEGFQMMLDLGETVDTLADKTGFSKSTIYHRTNLAKLDREALKKVDDESFQLSISDLYELEKIKDIDTRNKILKKCSSSNNIKWEVDRAIRAEKREKKVKEIEKMLENKGIQEASDDLTNYKQIQRIYVANDGTAEELSDDIPEDAVFKKRDYYESFDFVILAPITEEEEPKEETEEDKKQKRKNEVGRNLEELEKELNQHLSDFFQLICDDEFTFEKDLDYIKGLWKQLIKWEADISLSDLMNTIKDLNEVEDDSEEYSQIEQEALDMPFEKQLLVFLYWESKYAQIFRYWHVTPDEDSIDRKMVLIKAFEHHGFQLEEEEQQLLNGTHELWKEWEEIKNE